MCQHFKIFKTPSVRTNRTGRGCISNSLNSLWNFYTHAPGMLLMYIHAPACYRCVSMNRHVIDAYPCTGMLSMRIHAPACYRMRIHAPACYRRISMHRHVIDAYPCTGMLSTHIHAPACYRRISMHRHVIDVYPCTGIVIDVYPCTGVLFSPRKVDKGSLTCAANFVHAVHTKTKQALTSFCKSMACKPRPRKEFNYF